MGLFARLLTSLTDRLFAGGAPLELGDAVPAVSQKNQDGQSVDLAAAGASGFLLVYFYPRADTPGCTRQACSLRDSYAVLLEKGVKVIGVSLDPAPVQRAFKEKYQLPFDLLADEDGTVVKAFRVPRGMGFAKRQAFLFHDGKLVWRDLAAATGEQADDVLTVLSASR